MTITEPNDTSAVGKTKTKRSPIGTAMRVLTAVTGSEFARKYGLADPINRVAYQGTKTGFQTLGAANRAFAKATGDGTPKRPATSSKGLFNLNPDDEQQMITETVKDFATEILRPAAYEADAKAEAPAEILERSAELGITMINVPEEYDGAAAERGVVTNALVAEAMAYGDMGLAIPLLAPSGVATTLTNFGSDEQQATYLPDFAGENVPQSAVVIAEPKPLFDAFNLATKATRVPSGYRLSGVKSFVPAAGSSELFIVGAELDGRPALFIVESDTKGLIVEADPGMGVRAARLWAEHGRLKTWTVRAGRPRMLVLPVETPLPARSPAAGEGLLIVCEDDERSALAALASSAVPAMHTDFACNGFEALIRIGAEAPAVVLTHLGLAGMDAIRMLHALAAHARERGTLIVVLLEAECERAMVRTRLPDEIVLLGPADDPQARAAKLKACVEDWRSRRGGATAMLDGHH